MGVNLLVSFLLLWSESFETAAENVPYQLNDPGQQLEIIALQCNNSY